MISPQRGIITTVAIVLRKRSDPMEVAKQFFAQAGFQQIEGVSRALLLLNLEGDGMAGMVTLWPEGQSTSSEHLLSTVRHQREKCMGDEIDKLFPNEEMNNSEEILAEYVRFFRLLRGLAQSRQCLVTLVTAYRPDVNRRNLLTPGVGENPMFQSFQEDYLGFLNPDDSAAMIREIGRWKQIEWDENAARRVFDYCGGHPLITRFFASYACEEGAVKAIDYLRVEETVEAIQATLRRNEIGNYYREGIWELLRDDEQQVLRLICEHGQSGFQEAQIPQELEDALTNVERFGLVASHGDSIYLTGHLFHVWLERRIPS
jgi:hypothetical protein